MDFGLMTEPQMGMTYDDLRRAARLAESLGLAGFAPSDPPGLARRAERPPRARATPAAPPARPPGEAPPWRAGRSRQGPGRGGGPPLPPGRPAGAPPSA